MLGIMLRHRGFRTVAAHVPDLRAGKTDLAGFLAMHDPQVFLYDISIPYDRNWEYLQNLRALPAMQGRQFVLTTTNKRVLEGLVGPTDTIEIHGKPYDLEAIVQAVERAAGRV